MTAAVDTRTEVERHMWFAVQVVQVKPDHSLVALRTYEDVDDEPTALSVFDQALATFRREIEAGRAQVRFTATAEHRDHSGSAAVHPYPLPAGAVLDDDTLRHFGVGSV